MVGMNGLSIKESHAYINAEVYICNPTSQCGDEILLPGRKFNIELVQNSELMMDFMV